MYHTVSRLEFVFALTAARDQNEKIRESVTHPTELPDNARFFLHSDAKSGFGLVPNMGGGWDLIALFSLIRGRGPTMVQLAVVNGATTLDCYDGFLVTYYESLGFEQYAVEKNWNGPNYPDVVFMVHRAENARYV